jgi:hypothetical protein
VTSQSRTRAPLRPIGLLRRLARLRPLALLATLAALTTGCTTTKVFDYGTYFDNVPRSILVLPPLDETPEVDACYDYLSTVTYELAERGYYVFPVAVVDRMLRDNGLPTPGEMHTVPLAKLREVFGADAVLYTVVKQWGTRYMVLSSVTTVEVHARLVDLETGEELWNGVGLVEQGSGDGGGGLGGMLANALINQISSSAYDPSRSLATDMNARLYEDQNQGLLLGPYHPEQEQDTRAKREALEKYKKKAAEKASKPATAKGD